MAARRKPKLAAVHVIYEHNASSIAAMLRQAADNIENGNCDPIRQMTAVAELEDGGVQIYGWGNTDTMRSMATLQLGLASMARTYLAEE